MKMRNQTECPKHFKKHTHSQRMSISPRKLDIVWRALQKREAFTYQFPPYRVEFESGLRKGDFYKGELNMHHGPFLSAHGVIADVTDEYRDLQYFYGSYVLTNRWVRPIRLEFFKHSEGIEIKLSCYVKNYFYPLWWCASYIYWGLFAFSVHLNSLFVRSPR